MLHRTKNLRLIELAMILNRNAHYVTSSSLSKELGVTERTIFRDLDDLIQLGFPIYNDRGYKMHKVSLPSSWSLIPKDVSNIQLFLKASPLYQQENFKKQIDHLILKLKAVSHSIQDTELSPIHTYDSAPKIHKKLKMQDLEKALCEQLVCNVFYQALEEESPKWRKLHPYAMTIREGKWYVISKNIEHKEIHSYRLERIQDFQLTNKTFKRDKNFSIENYFEDSWSVYRGEKQEVKLKLRGLAIRIVEERNWIKPKNWKKKNKDEVVCTITVQGTEEILSWALSMAPNVEILEPEDLRNQMKITLAETLSLYKSD